MENVVMNISEENTLEKQEVNRKTIDVYIGNDNGNSEHDIIINNHIICQPNVFARVKELPMLDEVNPEYVAKNIEDNLIVTINSPACQPSFYYVGNYALKSGKRLHNMEVGVLNDKSTSEIVVVNTLSQIAGFAVKEEYKVNNKLDNALLVRVDMTAALPVKQYSKAKAEFLANKFMNSIHYVTVHVGTNRVDVAIQFVFVKILPEAVPATFALQKYLIIEKDELNDEEKKRNELVRELFADFNVLYKDEFMKNYGKEVDGNYFKGKKILHIGIGEGTTEYPLVQDIIFDPDFIHGTDNGVGHAIENALPDFKARVGLRTFTRQNYSSILRDPGHKYYQHAMDCVEDHLEGESEDILKAAKGEVEKANNDVDIICVHGGGSILMKDYLYAKLIALGKTTDIKIFYVPEKFAVTLEAVGMNEFTKSVIFKKLKEKATGIKTAV